MKKTALLLIFTLLAFLSNAQQTINDPNFGFQFSVPDGWDMINNNQESYLFTSNDYPGLIAVSKEQLSDLATIKQNMLTPYNDGQTQMASSGNVETLWPNALGTDLSGIMFNTQCKAYIVDVLLPGIAVGSVLVSVESGQYNDAYKQMCIQIARSINNGGGNKNQYQANNQSYNNQPQTHNQGYGNQNATTKSSGDLSGTGNAASEFAGYRLVWIQVDTEYSRSKVVFDFCKNGTFKAYEFSGYAVSNLNGSGASDMGEANLYGKWRLDKQGENYKLTTIDQQGNKEETLIYPFTDEYGDQRFNIGGKGFGYYGAAKNCY